jgi:predicted CopG family antitoxin
MAQKSFKTIVIHEETYEELKKLGNVTESFNDVIWKLIDKAATGSGSFQGHTGQVAVAVLDSSPQPGGQSE